MLLSLSLRSLAQSNHSKKKKSLLLDLPVNIRRFFVSQFLEMNMYLIISFCFLLSSFLVISFPWLLSFTGFMCLLNFVEYRGNGKRKENTVKNDQKLWSLD